MNSYPDWYGKNTLISLSVGLYWLKVKRGKGIGSLKEREVNKFFALKGGFIRKGLKEIYGNTQTKSI